MAAFDEICGCSYETKDTFCLCVNRKDQARERCHECLCGRHSMEVKDISNFWEGNHAKNRNARRDI